MTGSRLKAGFKAFFDNIFQRPVLRTEIGKHLLKMPVIVLKILDLFNIRRCHTAVSRLPVNGMDYLLLLRLTVRNVLSRRITMNIVFLGIDLAKNVFQLCGLN